MEITHAPGWRLGGDPWVERWVMEAQPAIGRNERGARKRVRDAVRLRAEKADLLRFC